MIRHSQTIPDQTAWVPLEAQMILRLSTVRADDGQSLNQLRVSGDIDASGLRNGQKASLEVRVAAEYG